MFSEVSSVSQWFALTVVPRHEKVVATALNGKGYVAFLPCYRGWHRSSRRVQDVELPLFPTYVFCRFDPLHRLPILTTPGVRSIVSFGRTPAPIDDDEIASVQTLVQSGLNPQPWPYARAGDSVMITAGPLRGVTGTLLCWKSQVRLIVSITLLQRSVAVEVDLAWVRRVASDWPQRLLSATA